MQQMDLFQSGQSGKMSLEQCLPTKVLISGKSLIRWQTQGRWSLNGNCWIASTSTSPNADAGYSLSLDIILLAEDQISPKYFLSTKALNGLISRQKKKVSCSTDATESLIPSLSDTLPPSKRDSLYVSLVKHVDHDS